MNNKNNNILIAGGGTGGHLFPAIAIGEEMIINGYNVKFIGSKKGFDSKYLEGSKYDYKLLDIYGYKRGVSIKALYENIWLLVKIAISTIKMIFVFIHYKPIAVIGTGGYISAIPLMLGKWFKKKIFIQEQNIIPGKTTKLFSKYADKIFIGFNEKSFYKNNDKLIYTGNPIRGFKSKSKIDKNIKNQTTLLILGGSQGAEPINNFFINNYKKIIDNNIYIIWQCGEKNYINIKDKLKNNRMVKLLAFIENMEEVYIQSDLVVSRAGAISISELMMFNRPSIFIPFPHATDDHQYFNAKYIESKGAGVLIEQDKMQKKLINKINNLLENPIQLEKIKANTSLLFKSKSAEIIINEIMRLIK